MTPKSVWKMAVAERDVPVRIEMVRNSPGEGAALVEDVVERELLLGDQTGDAAIGDQGGAVVAQPLVGDGDPGDQHHPQPGGFIGETLEFVPLSLDEALPMDQVLDRVAADELLLEDADGDAVGLHVVRDADGTVDIRRERPNRGVDAGKPDSDQSHVPVPALST